MPPECLEGMNRMDKVLISSNFGKEISIRNTYDKRDSKTNQDMGQLKLEKPIEVLFEGIDLKVYDNKAPSEPRINDIMKDVKESFCFLFVGHWLQGNLGEDRKDIGMMIKSFLNTFKNQKNAPALILKTSSANFSIIDRREMIKKIDMVKSSVKADVLPNIYLLHGDLTDEEMNEMYNHPKVKAHLTFTHGEGFGRPLLEASFSGKPILAPLWSGQKDFLNKLFKN